MKRTKLFLIVAISLVIVSAGFVLFNNYKDKKSEEKLTELIEYKVRFDQLVKDFAQLRNQRDSLREEREKHVIIIQRQKKNSQIIMTKYEAIHDSIDQLNSSKSYELYTNNINKYKQNRKRYSLNRFK